MPDDEPVLGALGAPLHSVTHDHGHSHDHGASHAHHHPDPSDAPRLHLSGVVLPEGDHAATAGSCPASSTPTAT